ncbi:MAG: hypothetical protein V4649_19330 [Bacteroidota bacterium]
MKKQVLSLLLSLAALSASAQDGLFGPAETPKSRKGFILNGNASFDLPGADMSKRFGVSYRLGPAVLYKTTSNWLFGAKFDFIMGNAIREDSLMANVKDKYNTGDRSRYEFLTTDGQRVGVRVLERGYAVGVHVGKIISWQSMHPDNGLMLLTTAGFMQHKLNIFDKEQTVAQIRGTYKKGYDRLTNGIFIEQYAGYAYFANNKRINFHIGLDVLVGFTQGRREYLYDVMRPDNKQRIDILFGVRGGWFIPIFKRRSEELIFE